MTLSIKVVSYKGNGPREIQSICSKSTPITIGRDQGNLFVLNDDDKYVSRNHAYISFDRGRYYIVDTSSVGTYVHRVDRWLQRDEREELYDGDLISLAEFVLQINIAPLPDDTHLSVFDPVISGSDPVISDILSSVDSDKLSPTLQSDNHNFINFLDKIESPAINEFFTPPTPQPLNVAGQSPEFSLQQFDIKDLFDDADLDESSAYLNSMPNDGRVNADTMQTAADRIHASPEIDSYVVKDLLAHHMQSDNVQPALRQTTEHFSPNKSEPTYTELSSPPPDIESSPVGLSDDVEVLIHAFLKHAGINGIAIADAAQATQMMQLVGTVLHELLAGVMDILHARAEFKSQFRATVTTIRPIDNNPLKVCVTAEDALRILLNPKRLNAFLDAPDAIRESVDDLMQHHFAMMAGIQASLNNHLHRFDPECFENKYDGRFTFQKESKLWVDYCKAYPKLVDMITDDFFGEAFVSAYEDQTMIMKLKSSKTIIG